MKYSQADCSWTWQYVFLSPVRSSDPRPDAVSKQQLGRRHHVYPESVQRAVRKAFRLAQIHKPVGSHMLRHFHVAGAAGPCRYVSTTMLCTHVLSKRGRGVLSPLNALYAAL